MTSFEHPHRPTRVLVWNEGRHEQLDPRVRDRYPAGIHGAIASGLSSRLPSRITVSTAVLDDDDAGLPDEVLGTVDVLLWWGHMAHEAVPDELVERIHLRVLAGMGLIVLHSGHFSKIFRKLMGTTCALMARNNGERELVWTVAPEHPIARGVANPLIVTQQEVYGEFFDIPTPDELVFISSFEGGEVFRSGVTYTRGKGRIFYFSPGDEEYPVYHDGQILDVLANAVAWALPLDPPRAAPKLRITEQDWFLPEPPTPIRPR